VSSPNAAPAGEPFLSEEELLARFHRTQDRSVRARIVERYMPLARSLALRYRNTGEPVEDLVQVASVGLLNAIDRYDPERGSEFAAFAAPTILGELRHYFRDATWKIHMPRGLQERAMKIAKVNEQLEGELQRKPTVEEIAERGGLETGEVTESMEADRARQTMSLEMPRSRANPDASPIIETIGGRDNGFDKVEAEVASASADLDERERVALTLRFQHGLTQRQIGARIGVSQMQVSRLLRRALKKVLVAVRGGEELEAA
jgi:RNA polymerase sigma-B factor